MAETVLFAEQTVSDFAYVNTYGCFATAISPVPFIPEEGRSYIVNWDGEQFIRTAFTFTAADGVTCIGIGNTIMTGVDSGEPFLITYDATNGYFYFFSTETDSSHTISVFLLEDSEATTETVLLEKQVIEGFAEIDEGLYCAQVESDGLILGERYRITWDEVVYYCTCKTALMPCVGNASYVLGGNEPGEPFAILSGNNIITIYTRSTGSSHTIAVSQVEQPIVLKDRNNNDVLYDTTSALKVPTADGGTRMFTRGEAEETTVVLDFSNGDMEVVPDARKLFSKVSIPTPVNLVPENIPKGITIAGVKGDLTVGGEVNINDKPIRFYDPYGNVIYGYSRSEIQEMTALPAGPALSGLNFDRWTHTLDELKAVTYYADVGPMYKYGSTPATVLIVEIPSAPSTSYTSINLRFNLISTKVSATIYWGDGSSSAISKTVGHTYAAVGGAVYNIAIVSTSGLFNLGIQESSYNYNVMNNQVSSNLYGSGLGGTADSILRSVLIGSYNEYGYPICVDYLTLNNRLQFVSTYKASARFGKAKQYGNCPGLRTIAGEQAQKPQSGYNYWCCVSLKRLSVTGAINANTFLGCDSLEEVIFGSGTISAPEMNSRWAMLMTTETPPTVGATSPQWGTKPIYVPDSAVDAYKDASGWSNAAAYILPASQYPDK